MTKQFWRTAILTAALGVAPKAEAAIYYWQDSGPAAYQDEPMARPRQAKARRHGDKKAKLAETEQGKPQGPLIISISLAQQRLRLYDANGLFAESPVSTGMPGHSTPMGVFSVIQKQKFHRSNIYSGAPMPYMQRITWSGVAIHAGVLPGYPASHGCIRMPTAFAVKMWNWTRMGARVVITPEEVSPASFSHPLLATPSVPPQPSPEVKPEVSAEQKPLLEIAASPASAAAEPKSELRSSTGHADTAKPAPNASPAAAPGHDEIHQASNAASNANVAPAAETMASGQTSASKPAAEPEAAEAEPAVAAKNEAATFDSQDADRPLVETNSNIAMVAEAKPEATKTTPVGQTELSKKAERADEKPDEKPTDAVKATPAPAASADKVAAAKTDPEPLSRRAGQIAVFVSRKDAKLYVRQNFSPLFSVPISIASDERPLGTHIFTARVDKDDADVLHWSVVSLPAPSRHGEEPRRRKVAGTGPIEMRASPVADDPTEALNRLALPSDVMARIFAGLSTGGSIIVSDQGIAAGETGEGTDFIVSLR